MRMTDTSSSYEGFEIIERHLKRLASKERCALAVLAHAASSRRSLHAQGFRRGKQR
jgi:hypothetical protein